MTSLITDDWLVADPDDCRSVIDATLSLPNLRCGVVMLSTGDELKLRRRWCVCLQYPNHTFIEQRQFVPLDVRHPTLRYPNYAQKLHAEYAFHRSTVVRGSLGFHLTNELRAAGVWRIQGSPIDYDLVMDGMAFHVSAWSPKWGSCVVRGCTGAIYQNQRNSDWLEGVVGRWCGSPIEEIQRSSNWYRWRRYRLFVEMMDWWRWWRAW